MPWPVHPTGFFGARGDQDTYKIERSLRFNSADSAYLSRTPASAGNLTTWTWSGWFKRSKLGASQTLFSSGTSAITFIHIQADDTLRLRGSTLEYVTTQVFRDVSSWYHLVVTWNTGSATAGDRVRVYINGSEVNSFLTETHAGSSEQSEWNKAQSNQIGRYAFNGTSYFDGYLTEINFIDGQALTPSSFGETDAITGRWKAKAYSGTYGTNGFYLSFKDNTSTTTLGYDDAGSNDWTLNNFSVTAGVGNDSLVDSPTNYGMDTGVGGEVRGNYCTWNPLVSGDTAANGNLDVTNDTARGNHELMKYNAYWEVTSTGGTCLAGIISTSATSTATVGSAKTFGFKLSQGGVFEYANVTDGSAFASLSTATVSPVCYASTGTGVTASLNCGQRAFAATAPSGFKAICTTNLPAPSIQKPSKAMDVVTYTGTGSALTPTSSLGFTPDLVWIKGRSGATDHALYDSVRGAQARLESNNADAEVTSDNGVTSFDSAGFTLGTLAQVNTNAATYVAWAWDAGSSNVTNTAGSITSTVMADATKGFSIVSYTGTGANATVGHGLGVAPKIIIVKRRDTGSSAWSIYYHTLTAGYILSLNSTSGQFSSPLRFTTTLPTSSVFSIGTDSDLNASGGTYIAYCFSEIEGYSKFGSYTGNGSADGPFVWCGFRPSLVIAKSTGGTGNWTILDHQREGYNVDNDPLFPNLANAEGTTDLSDFVSNGFKIRTTDSSFNTSGSGYVFSAWAEAPFKYSRAR